MSIIMVSIPDLAFKQSLYYLGLTWVYLWLDSITNVPSLQSPFVNCKMHFEFHCPLGWRVKNALPPGRAFIHSPQQKVAQCTPALDHITQCQQCNSHRGTWTKDLCISSPTPWKLEGTCTLLTITHSSTYWMLTYGQWISLFCLPSANCFNFF